MIDRYTPKDFAELWSDKTKYQTWFEVELAACEAMEAASLVPKATSQAIRPVAKRIDAKRIDRIEQSTRHDVIAFLTHVEELAGAPARFLHRGMTSSDVLDTSLALLLSRALELIDQRFQRLLKALARRIKEHRKTPMIGRTHGIHAEPLTFGLVLASHYAEIERNRLRLKDAHQQIKVGKLSGAVGTYVHLEPSIEKRALGALGLRPEDVATQIVPRDRHAVVMLRIAIAAAGIERLALNIRHFQRSEVREAQEPFNKGQKGSSAMPHKKNPILSENICGLARYIRSAAAASVENIALWHERDISHSSVERMMLPDVTSALAFILERSQSLIEGLVVYPKTMKRNLELSRDLWASEAVLLRLVDQGVPRQQAYGWVQRNALKVVDGKGKFVDLLLRDKDIARTLKPAAIRSAVNLKHALRHVDAIIDRALSS